MKPTVQLSSPLRSPSVWAGTGWLLLMLTVNFLLRLPTWRSADWGQFAFYDPGTVLKGDMLLSKGYVPTVDFGYTHGLLSLLYGRIGFAVLGRNPAAFLILTFLTEIVMAWAIARILIATGTAKRGLLIFIVALPMAIMPAYLTLTHPLEAMLILLALASQAEGKRSHALALLTACIFVKPSMAYVYGFLLVVLMVLRAIRGRTLRPLVKDLTPAFLTGLFIFAGLTLWMGAGPVIKTILPTTGASTYAASGFGFFAGSGREFWMPPAWSDYVFSSVGVFLIAAVVSAVGAMWAATKLNGRNSESPSRLAAVEMLFTVGILHTTFLLAFYGWSGSWTYYSYLPVLGITLLVTLLPVRKHLQLIAASAMILLLTLSYCQLAGEIALAWRWKIRTPETAGLWADSEQLAQWQQILHATHGEETLIMTNGWIPQLPPNCHLPDAWFPEPGIPTRREIDRVKQQVAGAQNVIIWWEYREFDLWNSADFADLRDQFGMIAHNERFTLLHRK